MATNSILISVLFITLWYQGSCQRYCIVCSGHQCLQNPYHPDLYPGKLKCHPVNEYCITHVRYLVNNQSLESGKALDPSDYAPQSVTRNCAKTWAGNSCRRDYLGRPEITCFSSCNDDLCNCDTRSPPPEMFVEGKPTYEAPKRSTYSANDLLSCHHLDGVPGTDTKTNLERRKRIEEIRQRRQKNHRFSRNKSVSVRAETLSCALGFFISMVWMDIGVMGKTLGF